jgi:ABC-type nitrate/sulfonate/bicarbonate transport system substrate-binding protein
MMFGARAPVAIFVTVTVAVAALVSSLGRAEEMTICYPTRSGASWPMFLAKEGGYYQKYGLDVTVVFGVHPACVAMLVSGEAQMANYGLEPSMLASSRDGSLVAVGSSLNKGMFALLGGKAVADLRDLKGKRLGISRIGDTPYQYTVSLLREIGLDARDVEWLPVGTDVNGRAAALAAGRVDATLLTPPSYFKLEEQGFKVLARLADYEDIYVSTVYLFKKSQVQANPTLPERVIKAHAEAIKRFYEDKAFAVRAYVAYDRQDPVEIARVYDLYVQGQAFERVPYVLAGAVQSVVDQADPSIAAQLKGFDFGTTIDRSIVDRLVREGFFETLFGSSIRAEQESKARLAFGR